MGQILDIDLGGTPRLRCLAARDQGMWDARARLLEDLDAFYLEHRRCGELESEAAGQAPDWVVMACTCGAQIARRVPADSS